MPHGVTGRWQAHHRTVAEHIVLAVEKTHFVTKVEVAPIVAMARREIAIHTGFPFVALNQHRRVGNQSVAADMIEVKMRVDDKVDLLRVSAGLFELRTHLFAGLKADTEQTRQSRTQTCLWITLAIKVHASVD